MSTNLAISSGLELTRRERQVLELLSNGGTDRQIAGTLSISRKTVEKHVTSARLKLGAATRTAAVATAIRRVLF